MKRLSIGRGLIIAAALISIVVPFAVDMLIQASLHMENPAFTPHAKLHTAMSVHAGVFLGVAAIAVLAVRWRRLERADAAIAASLAVANWVGLLLAGLWPGTAWSDTQEAVIVLGDVSLAGNVATSIIAIALGAVGFALVVSSLRRGRTGTDRASRPVESDVDRREPVGSL